MGMTVLHAAILMDVGGCYELDKQRINQHKLEQYFSHLPTDYSGDLINLLNAMLDFSPVNRPGFA